MIFLISDTFTDSLAHLTGEEQKATKTTAFDLQLNPASPGHSFHKLDKARDKRFWSVRVNSDIRLIVHRSDASLLLCYVDHHDKAYAWAERRKLETHPTTGAAQIVEVRETVVEIAVPMFVSSVPAEATAKPAAASAPKSVLAHISSEELLSYGVPTEWLADAQAATEDSIFQLVDHLPKEAAEALLELATGGTPARPALIPNLSDPFAHPDAKRRFRVMNNVAELELALAFPWDKWSVFLHPAQLATVTRNFSGPARVAGSAGTGKTVVALHRAVHLARENPSAKVLLTTFSLTLARMLGQKLRRLVPDDSELAQRITVGALDDIGIAQYERRFGTPSMATPRMMAKVITEIAKEAEGNAFSERFLIDEWNDVVDAWQLESWDAYRDVARLGRRTRLAEKQRQHLWTLFEQAQQRLRSGAYFTQSMVFGAVTDALATGTSDFDYIVVDEAQDVSVPQLRFLAALAGQRPNGLFFAGDLGQRIFQMPFSWKSLGVDVRGRSSTLKINYRTSHQIRQQADRLLGPEIADVDGNVEDRRGAVSVFNGADPEVRIFATIQKESDAIGSWIQSRVAEGLAPDEIGVFVRSSGQVERARAAISAAGFNASSPAPGVDAEAGSVVLMPMHLAKGLEFRAVVVAACDDEVLPLQERIEAVNDPADLDEVYNSERHLLYVACTRARDHLLVSAVAPGTEFLADLRR